ncbi:MAG: glycosyltransferase [Ginsengibacter sp.]
MNKKNKLINSHTRPNVLIAPLDWGLGHATRCIPIIKELTAQECNVFLAADKHTFSLLKKEFPSTVFLRIRGYEMSYSRKKNWLAAKVIIQIPKIIVAIIREKRWLNYAIKNYQLDAVISDNRFGMFSKKITSIYITHQLYIKTGNRFTEKIIQQIHYYFIKKYKYCWVPDSKENGLAGKLSHPQKIPFNVIYIGPLSRFQIILNTQKKYGLLISISGPEPQRTIFENIILTQLANYKGSALIVRGLPSEKKTISSTNEFVKITNHLAAEDFNEALNQSEIVISRSGYTTIMDLVKLNKKAILIPTPGQTEQEYLAEYLLEKGYFYCTSQENFSMTETLKKAGDFSYITHNIPAEEYKNVIREFVLSLKTGNFASQ